MAVIEKTKSETPALPSGHSTPAVPGSKAQGHQQRLAHLEAEVETLRQQLRDAQRLASIGTMTAMVAHEFNNILTPIISYAQLAQSNPALIEKALSRAADGGWRATNICKAILNMTHGASEAAEVNVCELISETLAAMAREPQKDGIELVLEAPGNLHLTTRRVELQQVLLNLLINARAAVLAKPTLRRIEVSAEKKNNKVIIRIVDNGIGIPPENLEKIFQPFFTTKNGGNGEPKGHGLGLTICREIVESLGGTIAVESLAGQGSTFTLRLPAKSSVTT